ncbi:MAG: glutathione S-transferase family protein [Hyphomicrobiaceae bacterium]|nr:glutathione S-transferase family protein [Hyphomicrobiaceae bacterium]
MIKVYGRANSINVRRVLWMLDEVGEPFQREDWGRGYRPTDDPVFQAINPVGVVPVIDDGDFRLRESNSIVRYLARKHNRLDLYPDDLRTRARIESFMDWSSTDFARGMTPVFHSLVVKNPAYAGQVESGAQEWARQMGVLDAHLRAGGPHVMGDSFTIADIPVGLVVNRWYGIDFPKPEFAAVAAYYEQLSQRPAYRTHGRNGAP